MKTLLIYIALLVLPLQSMAAEIPTAESKLFQIFEDVYTFGFQHSPCAADEDSCTIEISKAYCMVYGPCSFTLFNKDANSFSEVLVAPSGPSSNLHLFSYMSLRYAHNSGFSQIEKLGPRFRPNFRINSPLACTHVKSTDSFSCR